MLAREDVQEDVEEEDTTDTPLNVGEAVGDLAEHIIGTLTSSTQDVIGLFQEVVESVGNVLEEVRRIHVWLQSYQNAQF